jgi:hypothetical protein
MAADDDDDMFCSNQLLVASGDGGGGAVWCFPLSIDPAVEATLCSGGCDGVSPPTEELVRIKTHAVPSNEDRNGCSCCWHRTLPINLKYPVLSFMHQQLPKDSSNTSWCTAMQGCR